MIIYPKKNDEANSSPYHLTATDPIRKISGFTSQGIIKKCIDNCLIISKGKNIKLQILFYHRLLWISELFTKNSKFVFLKIGKLMKEELHRNLLSLILLYLLISGCAKMSSPTGGPKDRAIPVITGSVPLNGAVNFSGKKVTIMFDEYVVLKDINEKFMVSPPMIIKPEVYTRGKSVVIEYEEQLRENTTYTFYFQDAIQDLNENNAINNYQFVFSTGPFIDSLSVTGNVNQALDMNPPENTLVLLYKEMADSFVVKHIPDYITRIEKNGEFRIDNVQPGRYRLYALKDVDNSKNFNLPEEEFAFYPDSIEVTPDKNFLPAKKDTMPAGARVAGSQASKGTALAGRETSKPGVAGRETVKKPLAGEYPMILFQPLKKARYLTSSSRKKAFQLTYSLSLPPDSLEFSFSIPGSGPDAYFIEKSRNKDTITVWLTDSTVYKRSPIETHIRYPFTDSLGILSQRSDTVLLRFTPQRATRTRIIKRTPYKVNTGLSSSVRPDMKIILTAPEPFREPDTSRLKLYELRKDVKIRVPFDLFSDSLNSCRYYMNTNLESGSNYLFISDSAAFTSIYGDYSDSTGTRFSVAKPESFGKLILNISNHEGGRIIQLLDNTEKVLREEYMKEDGKLEFPLLEKGEYRLRAIFDLNGDGKWTTGDFDTHRQPEPVNYFPVEIIVKENWENNENWDLAVKNYKDYKLMKMSSGKSNR